MAVVRGPGDVCGHTESPVGAPNPTSFKCCALYSQTSPNRTWLSPSPIAPAAWRGLCQHRTTAIQQRWAKCSVGLGSSIFYLYSLDIGQFLRRSSFPAPPLTWADRALSSHVTAHLFIQQKPQHLDRETSLCTLRIVFRSSKAPGRTAPPCPAPPVLLCPSCVSAGEAIVEEAGDLPKHTPSLSERAKGPPRSV